MRCLALQEAICGGVAQHVEDAHSHIRTFQFTRFQFAYWHAFAYIAIPARGCRTCDCAGTFVDITNTVSEDDDIGIATKALIGSDLQSDEQAAQVTHPHNLRDTWDDLGATEMIYLEARFFLSHFVRFARS